MKPTIELAQPPAPTPKSSLPQWLREVDHLLRGEGTALGERREAGLQLTAERLQVAIVVLGMVYGLCMGTYALLRGESASVLQLISGMVKVPALFLITLLVTFPSLYVFNALVGSRLALRTLWRLLTSSVALNMAVLASFGPIVAFFSLSTSSYSFMLLLNVFVFGVAGILGLRYLLQTLHRHAAEPDLSPAPPPRIGEEPGIPVQPNAELERVRPKVKLMFRCWMVVFALVGAQTSWILRPFLGNPTEPFSFFRSRESNFFEAVWQHLQHLFR